MISSGSSHHPRFILSLLLLVSVLCAGSAKADAVDPASCSRFDRAVEMNDGSVVAAGDGCLAKLTAEGVPDRSFGSNGMVGLPIGADESVLELIPSRNGLLLVTENALFRYGHDGRVDPSFGGDGKLSASEVVGFDDGLTDATVGADGTIFVAASRPVRGTLEYEVARLDSSGTRDTAFSDGVAASRPPDGIGPTKVAVLPDGGIALAGAVGDEVSVIRLTSAGERQTAFGEDGIASSVGLSPGGGWTVGSLTVNDVAIDARGNIQVAGEMTAMALKTFAEHAVGIVFSPNGELESEASPRVGPARSAWAILSGGDLALAYGTGGRVRVDGTGGFADGRIHRGQRIAPFFRSFSISHNTVTGNLVSALELVGQSQGCPGIRCLVDRAAVAKIDAVTGVPVAGFGQGGVAMLSPNVCPEASLPSNPDVTPWKPCRILRPRFDARIRMAKPRSRKPGIVADLATEHVPTLPGAMQQSFSLRLPKAFRLNRGRFASNVHIRASATGEGNFSSTVSGRRVTVTFTPTLVEDELGNKSPLSDNGPVKVRIKVGGGAIGRLGKKALRRKARFDVTAISESTQENDLDWWKQSRSREVVKVKPVR